VTLAPKGLLIEEQRTNLLTYSSDYTNAVWAKGGTSIVSASAVAPNGTLTAQTLVENTATTDHYIYAAGTIPSATYSLTVFAKPAGRSWLKLMVGQQTQGFAYFNLTTGVIGSTTAGYTSSITPVGNGWYRCSVSGTALGSSIYTCVISLATANGVDSYTGDGTSGIYLWGAQLEAGAFATSYIPTVASQVTRAADSASIIGNNFARWYTQGVGTVFSQFDTPASGNRPVVSLDDNTANNMIRLRTEATDPYFRVVTGGSAQADLDVGTVASNTTYKMAGGFGSNSFLSCINAGTVGSDTSGTVPTVDRLRIGSDQAGAYLNGHIARTSYYSRVLTAAEDQGITS
jgi:hypothetical protein